MSLARSLCFLGLSILFFLFLLPFILFSLSIDECIKVNFNVMCPQFVKSFSSIVHSLLAEPVCLKSLIVFKLFHSQNLSSPTYTIVFVYEVPLSTSRWTFSFWPKLLHPVDSTSCPYDPHGGPIGLDISHPLVIHSLDHSATDSLYHTLSMMCAYPPAGPVLILGLN